jgi:hypothetical protein
MAPEQQEQATLPTWLREILGDIQTSRMPPRRRAHVRRHWGRVCSVMPDSLSGGPLTVYGLNVCRSGLAFVSQQTFTPGDTLTLTGPFCSGEPLRVSVVHCTNSVIGYHVGVAIEQACLPEATPCAEETSAAQRCRHTTKNGTPCKMPPLRGRDVCFVHCEDEDVVARRARTRQRAGQHSSGPRASTAGALA